jgi:hypothetical protein
MHKYITAEEVDRECITVWPLLMLEPDILTGATGFTRKVIRLEHFLKCNF